MEVSVSKEQQTSDPKYNIILTNFEPEMFAGVYIVGVFLGRHQVGSEFQLEITEGPAGNPYWAANTSKAYFYLLVGAMIAYNIYDV